MIDVNRLRVLVALDEEGTLAGAADGLGYAQATVTHHLQRLQSETGAVLVTHVGRRLRLTHEGRYLADQGRALLASLDRVERELQSMTDLASGVVRLAAFPSAVAVVVPAVLAALAERAPGLELQVVDAEPPEALQMLRRGDVDLALTFSYPEGSDDDAVRRLDLGDDLLHLIEPAAARAGTGGGDAQAGAGAVGGGADEVADLGPWRDATWVTGCDERLRGRRLRARRRLRQRRLRRRPGARRRPRRGGAPAQDGARGLHAPGRADATRARAEARRLRVHRRRAALRARGRPRARGHRAARLGGLTGRAALAVAVVVARSGPYPSSSHHHTPTG